MSKGQDLRTRFWTKVRKTEECWIWIGARGSPDPYGFIANSGRNSLAHRVSWELHNGPIPSDMQVCHKCDVPYCVRPDHLFLGTQADNIRDKMAKGRAARGDAHGSRTKPEQMPRGSRHGNTRLTEADVREMREEYAKGSVSQPQLAAKYDLSQASVNSILLGKTWAHAEGPITKRGKNTLTEDDVRLVRDLLKQSVSQREVARRLGVGASTINSIACGVTWAHVK